MAGNELQKDFKREVATLQRNIEMLADGTTAVVGTKEDPIVTNSELIPIKHYFMDGVYIREMTMKKGIAVVGAVHKHLHMCFLLLQDQMISDGASVGEELHKLNPTKHTFAGGCYIREIFNPANMLITTKIHKKEHPFFLMKGKMSILTENGVETIQAPHHGVTKPGTKRAIFTHEDCVFITVHATDKETTNRL